MEAGTGNHSPASSGLAGLVAALAHWLMRSGSGSPRRPGAWWRRAFAPGRSGAEHLPPLARDDLRPGQPVRLSAEKPADPSDLESLVEQFLIQGRYALLLRPQIGGNLTEKQFQRTLTALDGGMAMVPAGEMLLGQTADSLNEANLNEAEIQAGRDRLVRVEPFFLDRYPVTNRQFREFVAAGGYAQTGLWDASIWPTVAGLVDQSGRPGPRFWKGGTCAPGLDDHPVTGVSWHEAAAYARWVGKRLPSDAEWVKAACWPVALSPAGRLQRRYPWGDAMQAGCANLWGSGLGGTAAVHEYAAAATVNGLHQLIGNVWEWTRGDYRGDEAPDATIVTDVPIKSIRGGAFDTYFDNQATCHFASGEAAIARRPNIGLRCAIGVCDLLLARDALAGRVSAESIGSSPEEARA